MILPRAFFERDTLTVARELLGQVLVRRSEAGTVSGVIVETEAYLGPADDAAHSYSGRSERVRVQYGPAGCAYIYMIYGIHFCLNITSGPPGVPEVVLLRALEPLSGIGLMEARRGTDRPAALCSGPGKLCRALDIGAALYGADLCADGALFVETGWNPEQVTASKRIGIDYAVLTRDMPWRFTVTGSGFLSKPPGA